MKSVTDDNYVSYTSFEAQERLFAILNRCLPSRAINQTQVVEELGDGLVRVKYFPKATNEVLTVRLSSRLSLSETIKVVSRHGVTAEYKTRAMKEDGTKKRAPRKTKRKKAETDGIQEEKTPAG